MTGIYAWWQEWVLWVRNRLPHNLCPAVEASSRRDNDLHNLSFHFLFMISSMSMMFIMMAMTMTMICWFKYYGCICILALMMIVNEGVHYLGGNIETFIVGLRPTLEATSTYWSEWMSTGVHSSYPGIRNEMRWACRHVGHHYMCWTLMSVWC